MAKWGHGDPRWIVEDRPDHINVNNWHWTEKNASPWSIEQIKKLFENHKIESDMADLKFEEVEECKGDASAHNRKGKLFFFWDWNLIVKWSGKLKNSEKTYSGKVTIPNLSYENDLPDLDIQISVKDSDDEGYKLKEIMYRNGREVVRSQLAIYINNLKTDFSKGLILPQKVETNQDAMQTLSSGFNDKVSVRPVVVENNKPLGVKLDVTTLKLTQQFQCRAQEFYDALTRIEMVTAFTRAYVKLDATKGGKFELFGGNILGQFNELKPAEKIVMLWRYKQWPEGHFSTVTIDILEKEDHTEVVVTQTGVPKSEAEVTKENWQRYYWDSMKRAFGFGAFMI